MERTYYLCGVSDRQNQRNARLQEVSGDAFSVFPQYRGGLETMGDQEPNQSRRSTVYSEETLYCWEEIQRTGSTELRAFVNIITAGHKPGGTYENSRT